MKGAREPALAPDRGRITVSRDTMFHKFLAAAPLPQPLSAEVSVATVMLQLDPGRLTNPDLDIRYVLPDLLVERSSGRLTDDGYDYVGEDSAPCLLLFLRTDDAKAAIPGIIEVLKSERVLENDLSSVPVAVEDGDHFQVVDPPGFEGTFRRPGGR
jgi:hypothetical protein